MDYATAADIETSIGADALLVLADRDRDGAPDAAVVARAIRDASVEIDGYVGVRHALPLRAAPAQLVQPCVDIAIYRMAHHALALTEERRQRYEDAVAFLRRLADGKAALQLPPDPDAPDPDPADPFAGAGPRPVVAGGPPRLFGRDATRDL